ncbi:MAG: DUF1540 domain-containing protein [Clostridiales bacterium]|nr:DUF1540 domain-containing protein [Clostridiales bacterium]
MFEQKPNKSIGCTVKNCMYHCQTENHCSLEKIHVGSCEPHPHKESCTDCRSFEAR